MKKLLFGWLLKEQYQLCFLDSVIFAIEVILLFYIVLFIIYLIDFIKEKIKGVKNGNSNNK